MQPCKFQKAMDMHVCAFMYVYNMGFSGGTVAKNLPANAGDAGLILGQEDLLQ